MTDSFQKVSDQALEKCDQEPIRTPGAIQPFGSLVVVNKQTHIIEVVSENASQYLDKQASELIGKEITQLLNAECLHALFNVLGHSSINSQREYVFSQKFNNVLIDITAHVVGEQYILEFVTKGSTTKDGLAIVKSMVGILQRSTSLEEMFQNSVRGIRELNRYDRVMLYRFLPDGSGEIVNEDKSPHVNSFLGLRFPAWDIPKQARDLYRTTLIRIVSNVKNQNVPLIAEANKDTHELDLSLAILRATSPVHLEYLANMGVVSTMTLPIVIDNQLWGLIACHHYDAVEPHPDVLSACELAGNVINLSIAQQLRNDKDDLASKASLVAKQIIKIQDPTDPAKEYGEAIFSLVSSQVENDGLAIRFNDKVYGVGLLDTSKVLGYLEEFPADENEIRNTNDFSNQTSNPDYFSAAGLLCFQVSQSPLIELVIARKAITQSTVWAGLPKKDIIQEGEEIRLSPRKSFDKYILQSENKSDEWSGNDLTFLQNLKTALNDSFSTTLEIASQRNNLGILVHELNHRVRNILALVRSVAKQTKDKKQNIDTYVSNLEKRILALSNAHDLLTRNRMSGLLLFDIARIELSPYMSDDQLAKNISGPDLQISLEATSMAALVIHELVSNAVKYGALSTKQGEVFIEWAIENDIVRLNWKEQGGPKIKKPTHKGFGLTLLENGFPYEFRSNVNLEFKKEGFQAQYEIPISLFKLEETEAKRTTTHQIKIENTIQSKTRALLVEDSYILAAENSALLSDLGFKQIDTAATVDAALSLIDQNEYDVCLLDINLRGELSFPIAEKLISKNVIFGFCTGYGSIDKFPEKYRNIPIFQKPIRSDELTAFIDAKSSK